MRDRAIAAAILGAVALSCWIVLRLAHARAAADGVGLSVRREALLLGVGLYGVVLAVVTIVPLRMSVGGSGRVNFIPFQSVVACFRPGTDGPPQAAVFCLQNLIGNIMLFIPFGLAVPLLSPRVRPPGVLMAALACSVGIEVIQWGERSLGFARSVDIDDVLLNVVGALIGHAAYRRFDTRRRRPSAATND